MNSRAYAKMNYGLYVLSTVAEGKKQGCIISSFSQVTSSVPPKFTVTLNKDNLTCKAVEASGSFCVTMLSENCPETVINEFGYKSGRAVDKFASFETAEDNAGNPYLTENMVARVSCKVTDKMEIGNFILYVCQATEAEVMSGEQILTLDAFGNRGKEAPPTATVYRTMESKNFRCSVCGYVYTGEELPEGYVCPICHASYDKFEEQK